MPRASREYITILASGDALEDQRLVWRLVDAVKALAEGKRVGTFAVTLDTVENIEDEALDPEKVLALSEGKLPVLFVNVTFWTEEITGADLAAWEGEFELRLLGELITKGD